MKTMMLMMGLLVSTAAFAGNRGGVEQGRQGDRVSHGESRRGDERRDGDRRERRDDDRRGGHERFGRNAGMRHQGRGR